MALIHEHPGNQMLFNLNVPTSSGNMATRYHQPQPIVIEKCGSGPLLHPPTQPQTSFRFSSLSEDRLSAAVQLAKRDMKKKKFEEELRASQEFSGKKVKGKVKGQPVNKKTKSKAKEKVLIVKDREGNRGVRGGGPAVRRRPTPTFYAPCRNTHGARQDLPGHRVKKVSQVKGNLSTAVGMSPPTRDPGPGTSHMTQEQRHVTEILKLKRDVQKYVLQLRDLERRARLGQLPAHSEELELDEERRRAVRADEQVIRSTRTLYTLQQQARDIQYELAKMDFGQGRHRKAQSIQKLAAAYRASARAIRSCISHFPDQASGSNMPRVYKEVTLLVRQLSLCCAQLDIGGDMPAPEEVEGLVEEATEFSNKLDRELQQCSRKAPDAASRKSQPAQHEVSIQPEQRSFITQEKVPYFDRNELKKQKENTSRPAAQTRGTVDRIARKDIGIDATPDRERSLRAGIAALLRAADTPPGTPRSARSRTPRGPPVPRLDLPTTPRSPRATRPASTRSVAWNVPADRPSRPAKKGLLLPSQLQAKRERAQRAPPVDVNAARFSEPTFSSMMKQNQPKQTEEHDLGSPPRSARSPRRHGSPPPSARSQRGLMESAKRDIMRQVLKDKQVYEHLTKEPSKIKGMGLVVDEWVNEAERKIKEKLKPLLGKAQEIRQAYEEVQHQANHSLRHRLSEKAVETVETNTDLLADMILQDIMQDTALELQDLEEEQQAENQALQQQDAPSVHNMLQRLHQMEKEQEEIRRRWSNMEYEADFSSHYISRQLDALNISQPSTPLPFEVTSTSVPEPGPGRTLGSDRPEPSEKGAILFTKPKGPTRYQERSLLISDLGRPSGHAGEEDIKTPKIKLFLSTQMISRIRDNKERYEHYLKDTSHQPLGQFDPWGLVEEIADDILGECVTDVSKELDQINNEMVEHMYKSEFTHTDRPSTTQGQAQ